MEIKKSDSLLKEYNDQAFKQLFKKVYALSIFFQKCLVTKEYEVSDNFRKIIVLSESGNTVFGYLKNKFPKFSEATLKLAIFVEFYRYDLLIDITKSDIKGLCNELDVNIKKETLRFPFVFSTGLYQKYFQVFDKNHEILTPEETSLLLQNTPMGVFQVSDLLVGPFGVLISQVERNIQPIRSVPLWHCDDTACPKVHKSTLQSHEISVMEVNKEISNYFQGQPYANWNYYFARIIQTNNYEYDSLRIKEVPLLISQIFSLKELKLILKYIIDNYTTVRGYFPNIKRLKGSSDSIVANLQLNEIFQLLLLSGEEALVKSIEILIFEELIKIPNTEIRLPKILQYSLGFHDIYHECSRFGIRSNSKTEEIATQNLKNLILDLFNDSSDRRQLEWNLRHIKGESVFEKLDYYLQQENPQKILKEFIFSSQIMIEKTYRFMYGFYPIPDNYEVEDFIIKKLLWKLSYNINSFPTIIGTFWEKLEQFRNRAMTYSSYSETDKDEIRSVAVNFFVSLEDILDYTLSFVTWALLEDHFNKTKYKFNLENARSFMCEVLDGHVIGSNEPLVFDKQGKNTLFPLVNGFLALAEYCENNILNNSSQFIKLDTELPKYHGKSVIINFPFRHNKLILDLRVSDNDKILLFLKEITSKLEKGNVSNIRNRLQHKRKDFPIQDEIINCCNLIDEVVKGMEAYGIFPNVFYFEKLEKDNFGRGKVTFVDYKKNKKEIPIGTQYKACGLPSIHKATIFAPWAHIGDSNEVLRFEFVEESEYTNLWKDFPLKRVLQENNQDTVNLEIE